MADQKTKKSDLAAQIKKDMVNYIGPIFEELKHEREEEKVVGCVFDSRGAATWPCSIDWSRAFLLPLDETKISPII